MCIITTHYQVGDQYSEYSTSSTTIIEKQTFTKGHQPTTNILCIYYDNIYMCDVRIYYDNIHKCSVRIYVCVSVVKRKYITIYVCVWYYNDIL